MPHREVLPGSPIGRPRRGDLGLIRRFVGNVYLKFGGSLICWGFSALFLIFLAQLLCLGINWCVIAIF